MPGDEGSSSFVLGMRGMAWWGVEWLHQQACNQSWVWQLQPKTAKHAWPVFFKTASKTSPELSLFTPVLFPTVPHIVTSLSAQV